jgi:ATP-dependent Clp protease protease subunit
MREKNYIPMPYVIKQTSKGDRQYDIFSRLLEERIIFIADEISDDLSSIVMAQMLLLESEDPKKDIMLYINSPGGSISAGMAIYDTMQYIKCDVQTICMGMAASMGAFLLAGGTKGKRFALPNSEILIHQPLMHGLGGQATEIEIAANQIIKTKKKMNEMLANFTGKDYETLVKATDRDNWMTAEEAKEFGLIDKVIDKH